MRARASVILFLPLELGVLPLEVVVLAVVEGHQHQRSGQTVEDVGRGSLAFPFFSPAPCAAPLLTSETRLAADGRTV